MIEILNRPPSLDKLLSELRIRLKRLKEPVILATPQVPETSKKILDNTIDPPHRSDSWSIDIPASILCPYIPPKNAVKDEGNISKEKEK